MSTSDCTTRRCTKCGEVKPATLQNFHKQKGGLYGLRSVCRDCQKQVHKAYRQKSGVVEKMRADARQWNRDNRDLIRQRQRKNPEIYRAYTDAWRKRNPAKARAWGIENRDKRLVITHRYLARKRKLPDDFTDKQWSFALAYFHGCCAVCGRQGNNLFGTHTLAADHWIALTDPQCPGTVATNIVPLCHGEGGCNNSKGNHPVEQWLAERYGKRKTAILKRIADYFAWVEQQV